MNLLRLLVSTLLIIWLAATLSFLLLRVIPGDAVETQLIESGASERTIADRRAAAGLDQPLISQYAQFMGGLLRGDLGVSLLDGRQVNAIIGEQLTPTLELAGSALVIALAVGLSLGCLAGLDVGWGISTLCQMLIGLGLSVPIYWTGTIAIFIFTAQFNLLPSGGAGRLASLVLPAAILGFHTAGAIGQVVQAGVRETRSAEFVRTARAKGLDERRIALRHILRAGLLPVITVVAIQMGFLLSGVVITEALFNRPGIGRVLLDATLRQNYPVVQGVVVWSALVYAVMNGLADALYHVADPRLKP